jgi:hypothetical protein
MHRMGSFSSVVFKKKKFYIFPIWYCVKTMSCIDSHLGFQIDIKKNSNLVKDIPMIIHVQFGFSQFISFREEEL